MVQVLSPLPGPRQPISCSQGAYLVTDHTRAWIPPLPEHPPGARPGGSGTSDVDTASAFTRVCSVREESGSKYRRETESGPRGPGRCDKKAPGSSHHGSAVMKLTSIREDTGSIPGLSQWIKDLVLP